MPELWNIEAGQWETRPAEQVTQLVASGQYAMAEGRIPVTDPSGKHGTIPAMNARDAFRAGFVFETEDAARVRLLRQEVADAPVTTAIGEAVNMALGGLPVAHASQDPAFREAWNLAREENPVASTIGKVAGSVAPMGVGGIGARVGGKVASKAVNLVGGKIAKAAVSGAASGAVEGAAVGLSDLVTESSLGNVEMSASSVAAHVGMGALIGGTAGGVFGAAAPATKQAFEKIGTKQVLDHIDEIADTMTLKTVVGKQKRAFKQLDGKGLRKDAADYIRTELGVNWFDSVDSMAQKVATSTDELGGRLQGMVAQLDDLGDAASVVGQGARVRKLPISSRAAAKMREVAQSKFGTQAQTDARSWLLQQADEVEALGHTNFVDAVAQRRGAQMAARYDPLDVTGLALAKRLKASAWNDAIDEAAAPLLKKAGLAEDAYRQLRKKEWVGLELRKFAEDRLAGDASSNFFGLNDVILGVGAGAATSNPALGLAGAIGRKAVRKYGSAWSSKGLDLITRLDKVAHMRLATSKKIASAVRSGLSRGGKRAGTMEIAGRARGALRAAPASISALYGPSLFVGKIPDSDTREAAKVRIAEVDRLMSDPSQLADRIASSLSGLEGDAPEITQALGTKAAAVARFLQERAPRNPTSATLQPDLDSDSWRPSYAQASKYARYWAAAMDPFSALDEFATGIVTPEAVEALRELYPELLQETVGEILRQAADSTAPLSDAVLMQIATLTGQPAAGWMAMSVSRRLQGAYAETQSGDGRGGGGSLLTGIRKAKNTSAMPTVTQALEKSMATGK